MSTYYAKRKKKKQKASDIVFNIVNYTFFGLFALICMYPFYYVIINSISDNSRVLVGAIKFLPQGIHFQNYIDSLQLPGMARAAFNSVARTVVGTLFMLTGTSILGYAMSRPEYWHRKFWYRFMICTMYFGAGLIPGYMNIKRLGLMDTFWVYVVGSFISPYNMVLMKTYVENGIPQSLEEAAIMDGAGYAKRFLKIILPLSKPIISTVAIFEAVGQWNSYMDTILYTIGDDLQTLQSKLYLFLNRASMLASMMKNVSDTSILRQMAQQANPTSVRHTVTVITLLPVLLIYPFFQRYFTKGIMMGAVKG